MMYLLFLSALLRFASSQTPSNVTECYFDPKSPTRTFHSLVDYQGSKNSFNLHHPGYKGNVVNFDFVSIDRLPKNAFISFDSDYISKLSLDHKGIQTIDAGAFMGLFCLNELDLSFNNISHLGEGSFEELQNLLKLDLSYNSLGDIPDSGLTFFTLNGLRDLNLSHNKISTLEKYSFMTLTKLERLNLGYNKIRNIREGLFNYLSSLEELDLDHNYLAEISPENWKGLTGLKRLNLAGNYLKSFDTALNFSFFHLKTLNLSDNSLSELNVYGLRKHLPELEWLDLGRNSWFCEDFLIIEHHLKDSRITLSSPVNCSVVRTTSVKPSTTESTTTTTTSTTSTPATTNYAKEAFLQNREVLVSNKKLEDRVEKVETLVVWMFVLLMMFIMMDMAIRMELFRRCFSRYMDARDSREVFLDSNDAETVVLMRR